MKLVLCDDDDDGKDDDYHDDYDDDDDDLKVKNLRIITLYYMFLCYFFYAVSDKFSFITIN